MLNFVATAEQFMPLASQGNFQSCECWQAWKIFARFDALDKTLIRSNFFRQFLLRQIQPTPQHGNIRPGNVGFQEIGRAHV